VRGPRFRDSDLLLARVARLRPVNVVKRAWRGQPELSSQRLELRVEVVGAGHGEVEAALQLVALGDDAIEGDARLFAVGFPLRAATQDNNPIVTGAKSFMVLVTSRMEPAYKDRARDGCGHTPGGRTPSSVAIRLPVADCHAAVDWAARLSGHADGRSRFMVRVSRQAHGLQTARPVFKMPSRSRCLSATLSRIAVFVWLLAVTETGQPTPEQRVVGLVTGAMGLWLSIWGLWRPRWALYRNFVLAGWLLFCTLALRGPDAFVSASYATSAIAVAAFSVQEVLDGVVSGGRFDS
jgi:hypothetical protein